MKAYTTYIPCEQTFHENYLVLSSNFSTFLILLLPESNDKQLKGMTIQKTYLKKQQSLVTDFDLIM
jgi:hypothetical protein